MCRRPLQFCCMKLTVREIYKFVTGAVLYADLSCHGNIRMQSPTFFVFFAKNIPTATTFVFIPLTSALLPAKMTS
jgi:hypothetical protein